MAQTNIVATEGNNNMPDDRNKFPFQTHLATGTHLVVKLEVLLQGWSGTTSYELFINFGKIFERKCWNMLLESKCLFSLLSQLSLIHSFRFSFDFPQSLKRESSLFHMASSEPFAHNSGTLRTYKVEFSLALSLVYHSTKPLPIMSPKRRSIKQWFPNHSRACRTQDCEERGMFPENSASHLSPVLWWDQLLSQGPSGQAGPFSAKRKSFLLCESIYKLKFREEFLGSPEGQAGSVEWWFNMCSPGKSGIKPEKNKWEASVSRWVAWGVQVGTPLGQTDTPKRRSRFHEPCSKQAKLSENRMGTSPWWEVFTTSLPGRPVIATWACSQGSSCLHSSRVAGKADHIKCQQESHHGTNQGIRAEFLLFRPSLRLQG